LARTLPKPLPLPLLPGFLPFDSRNLATPSLGREPKARVATIVEFQSIIKSLYTHVFRKYHVLNETLLLKFACGVVVENNGIKVNWVAYAYLVYKRQ
jgi:hypothetical protein